MSTAATTGALIGLVVGGFHYVVTLAVMGKVATREVASGEELPGLQLVERRLRPIKLALLAASFLIFPLVGYVAGAMLTQGEAR